MNEINYNPDVLTCLANLSSDEVFTPPKLVNEMLDMLPNSIWKEKSAKFLDPVTKTGIFLREIVKRLINGLESEIPDKQERINHIFSNQIYGIGITELTSLLSRRSVYCSKTANGKYSISERFNTPEGNIIFNHTKHSWFLNNCKFCGASKSVYNRDDSFETYAYQFIHTSKPEDIFKMKFDVIIGNPPYQLDTGGSGRQAKPIYQLFVHQAKKMQPRYLSMIIPSRWFAGGMGLNAFRLEMINDDRFKNVVDFIDARECFPGVDIAGGVCYFLWDKDFHGDCLVVNKFKDKEYVSKRKLNEFDTFVRFGPAVTILRKVFSFKETRLTSIISATRPFGLQTKDRPNGIGNLHLVSSGGEGKISASEVTSGFNMIDKWKVMTSKTSHDHAGQPDKDGTRRILSRVELLEPYSVCTESYIILGAFSEKQNAQNCIEYVKTRFVRFLVSILSFSQDITRERFAYVPLVDFDENWTDEKLYKKYGLNEEEVAFIKLMIRPMDKEDASE